MTTSDLWFRKGAWQSDDPRRLSEGTRILLREMTTEERQDRDAGYEVSVYRRRGGTGCGAGEKVIAALTEALKYQEVA